MSKKIFMTVALFVFALAFVATSAYAEEVTVYNSKDTTYCVDTSSIVYTNSDIAFRVKVISYYKTYSPKVEWYFFEEEEDGTFAYVIGEGGMAHTVKRADEPAYSVFKYTQKYLQSIPPQPLTGA